jgi:hypothetical protein
LDEMFASGSSGIKTCIVRKICEEFRIDWHSYRDDIEEAIQFAKELFLKEEIIGGGRI